MINRAKNSHFFRIFIGVMQPLRRLIRESINLAENLQLADKVYFNPGRLSSEVKRIVLHITRGDAYTKIISDIVYAMLQQDERSSEFLMTHLSDTEEKPAPKGGYDVSKSNLQLKDWQKIRAYHNQLKAYDKNVYPIAGLDINNQKDIWKLINALNQRSSILEYIKKLPSIAIRNMKEDIRKPRTSLELQYYRADLEQFLKYYALLNNRQGEMRTVMDKKMFRSGVALQDLLSFVKNKQNLIGGTKIDKKFVKQIVGENSSELKIVYEKGNVIIIDVTGENGIKAIGCNSVWCFTYSEDSTVYRGPKTTWGSNHTNGHVYVIIDLSQDSDSPYLMYTLIKPLDITADDYQEGNKEKLVNMANEFEDYPLEVLGDLMDINSVNTVMNFGQQKKVPINIKEVKLIIKEQLEQLIERKSKFEKLEDNKVPLTDEERKKVMDADAVWHFSHLDKPSPAVWKSKDKKTGKITYVCHTHRAYQDRPTLKGAISIFHSFIKGTS